MSQEMTRLFYEDLDVGDEHQSSGRTVTETDVVHCIVVSLDACAGRQQQHGADRPRHR